MTPPRLRQAFTLTALLITCEAAVLQSALVVAVVLPFDIGPRLSVFGFYLFAMAILVIWPCVQCTRALAHRYADVDLWCDVPIAIQVPVVAAFIVVLWFADVFQPVFGPQYRVFAMLLFWFASATVLGFVAAGARVDVVNAGGTPGTFLITTAHNAGGMAGVVFAKMIFKDSPAHKDAPHGISKFVAALAFAGVLVFITRVGTLPTLRLGQPQPEVPAATGLPPR